MAHHKTIQIEETIGPIWHSLEAEKSITRLDIDLQHGLSTLEALHTRQTRRLRDSGNGLIGNFDI